MNTLCNTHSNCSTSILLQHPVRTTHLPPCLLQYSRFPSPYPKTLLQQLHNSESSTLKRPCFHLPYPNTLLQQLHVYPYYICCNTLVFHLQYPKTLLQLPTPSHTQPQHFHAATHLLHPLQLHSFPSSIFEVPKHSCNSRMSNPIHMQHLLMLQHILLQYLSTSVAMLSLFHHPYLRTLLQ